MDAGGPVETIGIRFLLIIRRAHLPPPRQSRHERKDSEQNAACEGCSRTRQCWKFFDHWEGSEVATFSVCGERVTLPAIAVADKTRAMMHVRKNKGA